MKVQFMTVQEDGLRRYEFLRGYYGFSNGEIYSKIDRPVLATSKKIIKFREAIAKYDRLNNIK